MRRREFLVGTAAGAATIAGWSRTGRTQAGGQAGAPAPGGRQGGAAAQGRGQTPANVPPEKLARVSIMTLNFNTILKLPWAQNPTPE